MALPAVRKRWPLKVLLAGLETAYNDATALAGDTHAIKAWDVSWSPMEGSDLSIETVQSYFSAYPSLPVALTARLQFSTALVGAGAAGSLPVWDPLWRMGGWAGTVTADTDVTYLPATADPESGAVWINNDGTLLKSVGARSAQTLMFEANQHPRLMSDIMGLWAAPTDAAMPTADLSEWADPLPVRKGNTTFSLHGVELRLQQLEIRCGQAVELASRVNDELIDISDRRMTGTALVEATAMSALNPFALAAAGTTGALALQHGTAAGSIVQLAATKVQLGRPSNAPAQQGAAMWSIPLTFLPTDGDDELSLIVQ